MVLIFTMFALRYLFFSSQVGTLLLFIFLPRITTCWQFAAVDLPEDAFIWKFAVWRNRAFLAIPRWQSNVTMNNRATLFEAIWPESTFPLYKSNKVFPSALHNNRVNDECVRSVVEVHVDVRGRLWLLEVPDDLDCSARIVIYNLKRNNQLLSLTDLINVPVRDLRALVVDHSGNKAYIGDPGDESIIAFMQEKQKWLRIKMVHGPEVPRIFNTDIAISRKKSILYMTGSNTLDLFSINLDELWDEQNSSHFNKWRNITVTWHGSKMGASSGLFCDAKDGLHYFMSLERASVRWDTRLPLKAESHSILVQNENCPCISDYAMDGQKNLWGLVNSQCSLTSNNPSLRITLKSRTIRIGKYSSF